MEYSFDNAHFWNALTQGGEQARSAIQNFHKLSELARDAAIAKVFQQASQTIDDLRTLEKANNRAEFKAKKDGLCTLLESIPALVTTPEGRTTAITQIQGIDVKSRALMDMDILIKCDDVETALKRSQRETPLRAPKVIDVSSIEELEKQLGTKLPPEVIDQIKKEGGAVILGLVVKKKDA
jgi:hypothetical protein